jgi:hypothetical protein
MKMTLSLRESLKEVGTRIGNLREISYTRNFTVHSPNPVVLRPRRKTKMKNYLIKMFWSFKAKAKKDRKWNPRPREHQKSLL